MQACNLMDEIFAPHERSQARRRLAELTDDEETTAGMFGGGLDAFLMAALVGATTLYAYEQLRRHGLDDDDSGWFVHDSTAMDSSSTTSGASEPSTAETDRPAGAGSEAAGSAAAPTTATTAALAAGIPAAATSAAAGTQEAEATQAGVAAAPSPSRNALGWDRVPTGYVLEQMFHVKH